MFERMSFKSMTIGLSIDIEIWIEEEKLHYNKSIFPDGITIENEISPVSIDNLTKKLDDLEILKWHRYYNLDKYSPFYELWIIRYKDSRRQRKKIIEGDTDYPDKWKKFIEIISEVVGSIK